MWLVLCHQDDVPALWAHRGLVTRGIAPLELVTAECLAYALSWDHRVGQQGTSLAVRLADGRSVASDEVRGVLNRVQTPVLHHWGRASEKDRDYVLQETYAFYSSWLGALPGPVLNPATTAGLAGAFRPEPVWTKLAARAGLATKPLRLAGDGAPGRSEPRPERRRSVFVAGDHVTGEPAPAGVRDGCLRLATSCETPLLAVDFEASEAGEWTFAKADPVPDLRRGGEALLDALAEALR